MRNGPEIEMGSCIYFMGADTFYKEFMKHEGIPFLREFKDCVVEQLEATKAGVEPTFTLCRYSTFWVKKPFNKQYSFYVV